MICSGIILGSECVYLYGENEKYENGSLVSFLEKEFSLPFSFVQLGMVSVHSAPCFCTFTLHFVQMLKHIVHLVECFVQLLFCTVGYVCCTIGLYLCAIGCLICTVGSLKCTNGVKT
jgi:hypothetical protein